MDSFPNSHDDDVSVLSDHPRNLEGHTVDVDNDEHWRNNQIPQPVQPVPVDKPAIVNDRTPDPTPLRRSSCHTTPIVRLHLMMKRQRHDDVSSVQYATHPDLHLGPSYN